ncbi:hypothetical protein EPN44_09860, partial [bacterium]
MALSFATTVMVSACGGGGASGSLPVVAQPGFVAPQPSGAPGTPPPASQSPSTPQPYSAPPPAATSNGGVATFAGCPIFTAGGWYNKPVAGAPTDPNSAAYINGAVAAG